MSWVRGPSIRTDFSPRLEWFVRGLMPEALLFGIKWFKRGTESHNYSLPMLPLPNVALPGSIE